MPPVMAMPPVMPLGGIMVVDVLFDDPAFGGMMPEPMRRAVPKCFAVMAAPFMPAAMRAGRGAVVAVVLVIPVAAVVTASSPCVAGNGEYQAEQNHAE